MVVGDFDAVRVSILPDKTDPPLIIDPDTVLPLAIAPELLEAIAGDSTQVVKARRRMERGQLSLCLALEGLKSFHALAAEQTRCFRRGKRLDHMRRI